MPKATQKQIYDALAEFVNNYFPANPIAVQVDLQGQGIMPTPIANSWVTPVKYQTFIW